MKSLVCFGLKIINGDEGILDIYAQENAGYAHATARPDNGSWNLKYHSRHVGEMRVFALVHKNPEYADSHSFHTEIPNDAELTRKSSKSDGEWNRIIGLVEEDPVYRHHFPKA
ncbi:MAG: hypothetical protein NT120_01915 [Candidatus Aenigmarchaeota archaeon]|nr:hypothetical protein [Candidatus Aenigmarchaeota archaeon]